MPLFVPRLVLVQRAALDYPLGRELRRRFEARGIELVFYDRKIPVLSRRSFREEFLLAKRTLVACVRQDREFQTCRPSAHYQLPLVSGCPGRCEYCYLNTNLGQRPYVKVYVNVDQILRRAAVYVRERRPETTVFEGAATSDPVAVEGWTGSLRRAVEFFATLPDAAFRFVTKYTDVGGLLQAEHGGKTTVRFSVNSESILKRFEKGVPGLRSRLAAAQKVAAAGYPLGFLVAPIFVFEGWRAGYGSLLLTVRDYLPGDAAVTFELITHRFTARARNIVRRFIPARRFPWTKRNGFSSTASSGTASTFTLKIRWTRFAISSIPKSANCFPMPVSFTSSEGRAGAGVPPG